MDYHGDYIRTVASVRFTDLIGIRSRMGMDILLEGSVIGRRPDNRTISHYVYAAAICWGPLQNHKPATMVSFYSRCERNARTVGAMLYLSQELEGRPVYASYAPDVPCSIEPRLVGLAVGQ